MRSFSFTQYSYYLDFFCLDPASCLPNHHRHGWVRYIETKKLRFGVCHSWYCLLIYNDSVILSCFILNCHRAFFCKDRICSFVVFSNITCLQKTKQSTTFKFYHQQQVHEPILFYQTKQPLDDMDLSGVCWLLWGRSWLRFTSSGFSNPRKYTTFTNQC